MAFKAEQPIKPVQFAHGHSADAVVIVVRRQDQEEEQFTFSPEQAEAFIAGMQQSIAGLKELQSRPAKAN